MYLILKFYSILSEIDYFRLVRPVAHMHAVL
jgi:hypothetical protein